MRIGSALLKFLRRDDRILMHVIIALITGYAFLTVFVLLSPDTIIDLKVSSHVQRYQRPWLDSLMTGISWFATTTGGVITLTTISLIFLLLRKKLEALFVLAPLLVVPIVSVVKRLVGRARPTADVVRVIRDFQHPSFPSGHVVFYVVFFGFLAFLLYRGRTLPQWLRYTLGVLCVLLVFTVPFSRMYLGAHWFTDVMAGFLLGLTLLIGLIKWYIFVNRKKRQAA